MTEVRVSKKAIKCCLGLAVLLIFLLINLNLTLSSPLVFGDEGFHSGLGRYMAKNLEIPTWLPMRQTEATFLGYHRPPLFDIFLASAWFLGGEVMIKFSLPLLSFLAGLMLLLFLKRYVSFSAGLVGTAVLFAMPAFITYSVMAYTEVMQVLFIICGTYFFFRGWESNNQIYLVLSGLFGGMALLTKITGLAMPLLFLFYPLVKKDWSLEAVKKTSLVFVFFTFCTAGWLLHNQVLYGGSCEIPGWSGEKCDVNLVEPDAEFKLPASTPRGVDVGIVRFGLLNYVNFAYGLIPFILAVCGLSFALLKRNRFCLIIGLVLITFFLPLMYIDWAGIRTESFSRFSLPVLFSLAAFAGIFGSELLNYLKSYDKAAAYLALLIILLACIFLANTKASNLYSVKNQPGLLGIMETGEWIRENTEPEAKIFTIYANQLGYHADRVATSDVPDRATIFLAADNRTYQHLKKHGFTHVAVQKFLISPEAVDGRFSWKFVKYLDESENFKTVHENAVNKVYEVL